MMRWLRRTGRPTPTPPAPPAPVQPKVPGLPCAYIGDGCTEPGTISIRGWLICQGHAHELAMRTR